MTWRSWRNYYKEAVTFTAMVTLEFVNVGINTLFKAASLEGMSYHVFLVYNYALAALLLLPAPFFSCRSRVLPPLSFPILCKIGLLGAIGITTKIAGYSGIIYSSPTLASSISNLTPAFTFILAILLRMEKLVWRSSSSKAKVMGTILSITGAFVVTLYKGPVILKDSESPLNSSATNLFSGANSNWVIGGVLLTVQYILVPIWYIVLTQIMQAYPAELTVVFFYNVFVSFMALAIGLAVERNASAWRIRPDITLVSIVCTAVFGSCFNNVVHSWALRLKGPVFVAMFKPFSIAIAFAMGIIFLGDTVYVGSLVGAVTISIGFYTVMWGKAKEARAKDGGNTVDSAYSHNKVPLLES